LVARRVRREGGVEECRGAERLVVVVVVVVQAEASSRSSEHPAKETPTMSSVT
jgi:hypothetical protein